MAAGRIGQAVARGGHKVAGAHDWGRPQADRLCIELGSTAGGHTVLNPALPDEDCDVALAIAQAAFDQHQPDVVVGSSRGGAEAMNLDCGDTLLVRIKCSLCSATRTLVQGTIYNTIHELAVLTAD